MNRWRDHPDAAHRSPAVELVGPMLCAPHWLSAWVRKADDGVTALNLGVDAQLDRPSAKEESILEPDVFFASRDYPHTVSWSQAHAYDGWQASENFIAGSIRDTICHTALNGKDFP